MNYRVGDWKIGISINGIEWEKTVKDCSITEAKEYFVENFGDSAYKLLYIVSTD